MKYILLILFSVQAFACKPTLLETRDVPCDECVHALGKCMSDAIEKSDVVTEKEVREFRNDCQNQLKVCIQKNSCLNKE